VGNEIKCGQIINKLEINDLTRDYGGGKGVFSLSFTIGEGEVFGFLGPNGAGKTTVIRHLMGFVHPQSGNCSIGGLDCWRLRDKIQKNVGYIAGELSVFDEMTGLQYLKFVAAYRGMTDTARMNELIELFELDPTVRLKKMSKGMKQKVGIVAAFMHDPQVLILDEPTSGLDPLMQNRFIDLVRQERERGKTILISSHSFDEIERTCHRVGIIRAGHLVAVETIDKLKTEQKKKYEITFENEKAVRKFLNEDFNSKTQNETTVSVTVANDMDKLIKTLSKYTVVNLSAPSLSLEEIFMQYYGKKEAK
jgi:ABC-2 type transport system ATP-binding protein